MSRWGTVISRSDPREIHVMPCDGCGELVGGHTVSQSCWCSPQLDKEALDQGGVLFVHRDPERGGYNA